MLTCMHAMHAMHATHATRMHTHMHPVVAHRCCTCHAWHTCHACHAGHTCHTCHTCSWLCTTTVACVHVRRACGASTIINIHECRFSVFVYQMQFIDGCYSISIHRFLWLFYSLCCCCTSIDKYEHDSSLWVLISMNNDKRSSYNTTINVNSFIVIQCKSAFTNNVNIQ